LEVWVDPWGVGGVFGGEALSKFLLDHPQDWEVLSDGRRVPTACLNKPAFRHFMQEWVHTARRLGAQVIFWDEPHFFFSWSLEWEGIYACVCDACQALYRREEGGRLPPRLTAGARLFRQRTLRRFLEQMMGFAQTEGCRNALCLYAHEGHPTYDAIWQDLSTLPAMDIFGCDPYWRWPPRRKDVWAHVGRFAQKVVAATAPGKKSSQIWIQAMRLARGQEGEIEKACQAAAQAGVTHLAAWSFDGGALLDTVLAEDPAAVWRVVTRAFAKLRGR
jgi:hypothetical protein